jgi:hypothetical protein
VRTNSRREARPRGTRLSRSYQPSGLKRTEKPAATLKTLADRELRHYPASPIVGVTPSIIT